MPKKAKVRNPRKVQARSLSGTLDRSGGVVADEGGAGKSEGNCSHYKKESAELGRILLSVQSSQGVIVSCDHCREDPPGKKGSKEKGKHGGKKKGAGAAKIAADAKGEGSFMWVCLDCNSFFCGGEVSETKPYGHARRHSKQDRHPWAVRCDDTSISWCFVCDEPVPAEVLEAAKSDAKSYAETSSVVAAPKVDDVGGSVPLGSVKGRVVRGLANLGNTCFFNSVMQNITALDVMRDYFSKLETSPGPLTTATKKLFMDTSGSVDSKGALNPKALFGCITCKAPQFRGYQQQDSHELLRYLLDGLQTEDTGQRKSSIFSHDNENVDSKPASSFVDVIFGGRLSSTVSCKECGHSSTIHEPFLDLSLPVPSKQASSNVGHRHPPRRSKPPPRETNRGRKILDKVPTKAPSVVEHQKSESSNSLSESAASPAPPFEEPSVTVAPPFEEPSVTAAAESDFVWLDFIGTNTTEAEADSFVESENLVSQHNDRGESSRNEIDEIDSSISPSQSDMASNDPVVRPDSNVDCATRDEDVILTTQKSSIILLDYKALDSTSEKTNETTSCCQNPGSMNSIGDIATEACVQSTSVAGREDPEVEIDGLGDLFNENDNEVTSDLKTELKLVDDVDMVSWSGSNGESNQEEVDDVSSPVSINSCLALFTKPEVLSGEHGWHCENCSKVFQDRNLQSRKNTCRATSEHDCLDPPMLNAAEAKDFDDLPLDDPVAQNVLDDGNFTSTLHVHGKQTYGADAGGSCTEKHLGHVSGLRGVLCEVTNAISDSGLRLLIPTVSQQPDKSDPSPKNGDSAETNHVSHRIPCPPGQEKSAIASTSMENGVCSIADSSSGECKGHIPVAETAETGKHGSCEKDIACGINRTADKVVQGTCKSKSDSNRSRKLMKSEILEVKRDAVKKFLIHRSPPILTIHLKRFSQDARGRLSKLRGHVVFQEMLDLKPYMDPRNEGEEECSTYRLVGVVEHSGGMTGGHYIAYVRGGDGNKGKSPPKPSSWFYASDAHVRQASLTEVLKSEAYILFYERVQH